jgi:GntR family transcriptional regulator
MEYADYRRIANDIQAKIDRGELKSGDRLASTSELAGTYGVSASTVYRAVTLLRDRGVVAGQSGKGVYVV